MAALTISSCGNKQSQEEIVVEKIIEKPQSTVKKVTKNDRSDKVKWVDGNMYSYSIHYEALDTVPAVENYGELYHDNAIKLTIRRSDGSEVCSKNVTKSSFSGLLSNDMRKHGVLLSLVFDRADSNHLYFVASVGSPDENNDDFVNLQFIIDRYGSATVATYTPPANPGE